MSPSGEKIRSSDSPANGATMCSTLVTDDPGGLNALQFGPDGMIYGPSWERGQVIRVDPETGTTEVLAGGFQKPRSVLASENDPPAAGRRPSNSA